MTKISVTIPEESKPKQFPLLAEAIYGPGINATLVVLFTNSRKGVVVQYVSSGETYYPGYYSDTWDNCLNQDSWRILPPGTKVTIEQE